METKKCAIYMDLENLTSNQINIPALMETLRRTIAQKFSAQSSFIVNMAAGNIDSIRIFEDTLIKYNFEVLAVKKISTIPEKSGNRADLILSLNAFETLLMPAASVAEIYIFVTRDSDFSVIMGKLRKYGKQVVLVTDSASAKLDIFKNTTDLILTFKELTETSELVETPELAEPTELVETPEPAEPTELAETPEPAETPETIAPVKMPENLTPALKALVNLLKPNEWMLYTSVVEKVPYKKDYSRFSLLVEEAKQKGILETRALKEGANELRLIQNNVSKIEKKDSIGTKDSIGLKTSGKIISTGKLYVRIESQDGIYRAYPDAFQPDAFQDKTLALESLLDTQVGFEIQTPQNNKGEGIAQNVVIIKPKTETKMFSVSYVPDLIKCGDCKDQKNCETRFINKYEAQVEHPCVKFRDC